MVKTQVHAALLGLALFSTAIALAGDDKKSTREKPENRVFIGGNFGFFIGRSTYMDLSPHVGYKLTKEFSLGTGVTYTYYRTILSDGLGREFELSSSHYGGRIFSRYFITEYLFAHAEYEALNIEYYHPAYPWPETSRIWVGSPLLGGGLAREIGKSSYGYLLVLYNFNEASPYISPYPNPVIRMGISAGL